MRNVMIDTHAHLDMSHFDKDREDVIARAAESGVTRIITVGIDLDSSRKAVKLAESHKGIYATAGIHPHDTAKVKREDIALLSEIACNPKVVAVGETGLDFYRNRSPAESQLQVLKWQLDMAVEVNLPVIIHCRQADKQIIPVLLDWISANKRFENVIPGVIHCFNGDVDTARKYLDMGFFISLGGYISYPTSANLSRVIRFIPQDRIVVETDCPFLPPQSHRGKRNETAYIPQTVAWIARIRQVTAEVIAKQTTENACRLFNLPSD